MPVYKIFLALILAVSSANAQDYPEKFASIQNWSIEGEKQYYSPDNLYDYINGASDFYLSYGFQDLWVVDYKNKDGQILTLELYRHENKLKAFGIYAEERPQGVKLQAIGAQGFVESGSVFFIADDYYVKVYNGRPEVPQEQFIAFSKAVANKICSSCTLPSAFNLFPIEGMVDQSEHYMPENFMGIAGFDGVCTVNYKDANDELRLFLYKADDAKCRAILTKYFSRLKYKKKLKKKSYVFDDPYLGMVKLNYKEGMIFGMLDAKNVDSHFKLYQIFTLLQE
jgi:hypothetical protein